MPPLVLYASRRRLLLLLAGSVVLTAGAIFLLTQPDPDNEIGLWVGVLFFGFATGFFVLGLVRRQPVLIVDETGIDDRSNLASAGAVPWSDILGVYVSTMGRQRSLSIAVADPERLLAGRALRQRTLMNANLRLVGAAINIPEVTLPISLEKLIEEMRARNPGLQVG